MRLHSSTPIRRGAKGLSRPPSQGRILSLGRPLTAALTSLGLAALLLITACGADEGAAGAFGGSNGGTTWGSDASFGMDAGSGKGSVDSGGSTLPPEVEKEVDFGAPEASPNFVFVPVKGADQVVKISGKTLKVTLVEVGDRPTVLKVVPGQDKVVVLNAGSDEVSVLTSTEDSDKVRAEPVLPHANTIALDAKGSWAAVFYDHARAQAKDPVGSFQAISLVRVEAGKSGSLRVSVGFRPRAVHFTDDGKQALVITDDGVSIIDLTKVQDGDVAAAIPLSPNPLIKPKEREVQTTPDGVWALVRESGLTGLRAVHLPSRQIVEIPLSSTPTDLDLSPDGKTAVAVLRSSAEVALVVLPKGVTQSLAADVISVKPLTAGLARITSDSQTALLYTSVAGIEQVATLNLKTHKVRPVALRKTVSYVYLPRGGHTAILVHKPAKGPLYSADKTEAFVDDSQGYTLFDLDSGFTKLVLTPVPPKEIITSGVASAPNTPERAWLLLPDPKGLNHQVQEARLKTLLTKTHNLGSSPEFARWLPQAGVVAVTQVHPSGRISFIQTQTGLIKTVTGYELNGLVK